MNRADPVTRERLELLDQLEAALGAKLDRYQWGGQVTPAIAAGALRTLAAGEAARQDAMQRAYRGAAELERMAQELGRQAQSLRDAVKAETAEAAA
jgi:HAMP domain-containing protein